MANQEQFNDGIILPTLIRQLKAILHEYPDDGQILKGPALYVYNDAIFTADDWRGIRMLNDSVKQKDPMKVGRFGLGFKSVFHLTDLPSIFSGDGIGFLDPHEQFFQRISGGNSYPTSSFQWNLNTDRDVINSLEDQFLPFHQDLFEATGQTFSNGYFNGTMFRFPLRIDGMHSDLCDTKYDAIKVRKLFGSLETDAHVMLLFLKSLECIEVYEKTSQTASPTKIMSISMAESLSGSICYLREASEAVSANRLQLINQIKAHRDGSMIDPVSIIYSLNVEFKNHLNNTPTETSEWLVSQYYAGQSELDISDTLGLLPWVGVALPVQENAGTPSYLTVPKGRIFCFLPLPSEEANTTGLRVHVNGYFAVDSNRRHLKWPTADQNIDQLTDKDLIWNEFLVKKLLVKALVKLTLHVANPENKLRHDLIFDIIPEQLTPQWKYLAEEFYRQLPSLDIFHSPAGGGQWMNSMNAVFDNIEDKSELQVLIRRVLLQNQTGLVSAPLFLSKHFEKQIAPQLVCKSLKAVQNKLSLNDHDKLLLLEYLLGNLESVGDLVGANLLPLEDGSWTDFKRFQHEEDVYIDSKDHPRSLLPGLENLFLRSGIQMFEALQNLAQSKITQLVFLSESSVPCLLRSIFPADWRNKAQAELSEAPHLSASWIDILWGYLNIYFPSDLKNFEDLHIIPLDERHVIPLNGARAAVMVSNHRGTTLQADVADVMKKLDIQIIDVLSSSIRSHPCVFGKYIYLPNATNDGLFGSIRKLQESKHQGVDYTRLDNSEKKVLKSFVTSGLAGLSSEVTTNRDILLSMPIFQTVEGSGGFVQSQFVSLNDVNQAAPTDAKLPVDLPQRLLDLGEILVQNLAEQLGIKRFTTAELLEELVLPAIAEGRYEKEDVIRLMAYVFDNFSNYHKSSRTFLSVVRNVQFIEKRDGSLAVARDLFDHCDKTLQLLFSGADLFAVGEFADSKYIHFLRMLGMKGQDSVTASDLLHVGDKLDSSAENPDNCLCAKAMLSFLENHPDLLDDTVQLNNKVSEPLSVVLRRMKWIQCELKRPNNYPTSLAFEGDSHSQSLILPTDVYSSRFGSVIGSVRPTINADETPNMARCYGWLKEPRMDDVVQHLLNVVSSYQQEEKMKVHFTINEIYRHMNAAITQIDDSELMEALQDMDWVWHGDGFVSHKKMVRLQPFMDLRPHAFQLSNDFEEFTELWNYFHLREKYDIVQVLKDIRSLHETSDCGKVAVDRDLHIAIEILKTVSVSDKKHEMISELLVPIKSDDGKLHLREIIDVTYSDQYASQDPADESGSFADDSICLVHPLLPIETAKALNIHGIINRMLGTEDLDFESYGQSEPLTTRLSNILKDYPDGLAVLKELVQNADDAGATEVKFLYDERLNPDARTGLIDRGMADLQGPAMWAYNDALFTSQDFDNLIKLSGATKEQNRSKIGRFGLGFNAVYNLTDAPSLVSQNNVVFLDPHTTFLGEAIRDKTKPGIKLDIRKNRDRIRFLSGQFKPYNGLFGCDFTADSTMTSYPGTLFRFPLRTPMQACTSEISKRHYSRDEVLELTKLLIDSGHQFFLFTQHIKKISVYHLASKSSSSRDMKQWFTIEKKVERILRSLNAMPHALLEGDIDISQQCGILDSVNKILTTSTCDDVSEVDCSFVVEITSMVETEVSEIMAMNRPARVNETTHWLISNCMGTGSSLAMAKRYTELGLMPVGGVAAKLRKTVSGTFEPVNLISSSSEKCDSGEGGGLLFCFLPLPIRSCFPVHINGSFAVTSSRMHLHENTVNDKADVRGQWNEVLIADAIARSYVILLEDLHKLCADFNQYALWPVHKSLKEAGILHRLTDSLYSRICEQNGPKLLKCEQLISVANCRFLEPHFRHQIERIGRMAQKIFRKLWPEEAVDIPLLVIDTVKQTGAWEDLENRLVTVTSFYENIFILAIHVIEEKDRDELVLHALFDPHLIGLLRDVVFCPVKPNRKLKRCTELVHPKCRLAILYDEEIDDCFPADVDKNCGRNQDDVYRKLAELGMKKNELSWKEIADRCSAVPEKPELVSERLLVLIQLMSSMIAYAYDESEASYVECIKKTHFLPTVEKPQGFPLKWAGDEIKFTSCENSYLSSEKSLVSCSFPIIDERQTFDFKHSDLKSFLGLRGKPVLEKHLLSQLKNVIELSDCNGVVSIQREQKNKVKDLCKDVYKRLDEFAKTNLLSDEILDELKNMRSIAVDKDETLTVMNPARCAFQLPVGSDGVLLPYLAKIPRSLNSNESLLRHLEVRQKFTLTDYTGILKSMHLNSPGEPLSEADLIVALCIVIQCLGDEPDNSIDDVQLEDVYIPDEKNVLVSGDKICYSDRLGLSDDDDYDDTGDGEEHVSLCHPKIPPSTARKLGLKTIREEILDRYSCEMEFGQSERLVNRIRRILTGYPFDKEVLKEMLQNTDDAGATEIHFINDRRQLPTGRVFADKWKPMQGPALCIYNNRPFTKEDIIGIQKLGEGSKADDPTKTGQYGVGFNCVYHLTDAPTFLTQVVGDQRVLCVFDPTCSFIPRATSANPGRRMNNLERLKARLPDVFKGYFEETYSKEGGTMFRLPLRSEEIAKKSQLLQKVVTSDDVNTLFDTFKSDAFESLLFLNTVEEIHLKEVDSTGEPKTIYSVKVELSAAARQKRQDFKETVKQFAGALKREEILIENVPIKEVSYELVTRDSDGQEDTWRIIQRFGFGCPAADLSKEVTAAYLRNDIGLLPRAGIAYRIASTRETTNSSRLFCFLPLPVTIDFPVHVNGQFALEYETRRSLWLDDRGGPQVAWNKSMMMNIVAPAYCTLIQERRDAICQVVDTRAYLSKYHLLFPDVAELDLSYVRTLSVAIYKRIETQNLAILPVKISTGRETCAKTWIPLWMGPRGTDNASWNLWTKMGWKGSRGLNDINSHFDNIFIQVYKNTGDCVKAKARSEALLNSLVECGFLVYNSPLTIHEKFKSAGVETKLVTPEAVVSFFHTYNTQKTRCEVKGLPSPIAQTKIRDLDTLASLLRYCNRSIDFKQKLLGLPLQATADGVLRCFDSNSVKYEPRFRHLVPHIQDKFLDDTVFQTLSLDPKRDVQLCKEFTVSDLARFLQDVLPAAKFYGEDKFVDIQEMIDVFKDTDLNWLQDVWNFLSYYRDVKPLNNWCLLPVRFNGKDALFPIHKYRCIITTRPTFNYIRPTFKEITLSSHHIMLILHKFGLPEPCWLYIKGEGLSFFNSLLCEANEAETIVRGFGELIKLASPDFTALENTGCIALLQYFSERLDDWKDVPNAFNTVKNLPIFLTVYDDRVRLLQNRAYIVPKGIPNTDMDSWTSTQGVLFLRSQNEKIDQLLQSLDCRALSEKEIYCDFIFKHFEFLTPNGRYDHLTYVKNTLQFTLQGFEQQSFEQSLRLLRFLPAADGSLRCASEVYDNTNQVFLAMEHSDSLPPEPFHSRDWNAFLKTCGMISTVTREMFVKYAKTVERGASLGINNELLKKSKVLVEHLCRNDDLLSDGFLQDVKSVAFVFHHTVDQTHNILCNQYGPRDEKGNLKFIPFEGAILSTFGNLVWSVQPILPSVVRPLLSLSKGKYAKDLGISSKPQCDTVAKHTNQLCMKWVHSTHEFDATPVYKRRGDGVPDIRVLASVLNDTYDFFAKNLKECTDDEDVDKLLRGTHFILDINRRLLLRPDQVSETLRPKDEICPYLVRIPHELMQYATLFRALGATEDATIDQYVMVLESIHANTKDNKLNPEAKTATLKAIGKLFKRLKKHGGKIELKTELFLLGNDDIIHKSCDLVFDNNRAIRKRLPDFEKPFLIDLQKECDLRFSDRQIKSIIKNLPANNQPSFLTSIVNEEMSRDFIIEESSIAIRTERKLRSDELKFGFMRLAHHSVATSEDFNEENISKALVNLKNISVLGVNKIECYLVFKGSRIPNSERPFPFFAERDRSEDQVSWKIYIDERKLKMSYTAEISLHIRLVDIIQSMTGNLPEHAASFVGCMLKSDLNSIDEILDDFGIEQFTGDRRSRRVLQSPGRFWPLHLYHMLELDIRGLTQGEFAALEVDDPLDRTDRREDLDNSVWPTFQVVKIVEVVREETEPCLNVYRVETGCDEFTTATADMLYAFDLTANNTDGEVCHSPNVGQTEMSLNDVKKSIKATFESTGTLPVERKRRIIKRLLLRWHSDIRDSDSERLTCAEATKYIWELGESMEQSNIAGDDSQLLFSSSLQVTDTDGKAEWTVRKLYEACVRFRTDENKKLREQLRHSGGQRCPNDRNWSVEKEFDEHFTGALNPQPGLGRSWFHQAEHDFNAAVNDEPQKQWVCHKYYQVALASLKGCHFATNANDEITEDIVRLANIRNATDIMNWSTELHRILNSIFCFDHVTSIQPISFTKRSADPGEDTVKKVQLLSKNILDWCKNYINAATSFGDTSFNKVFDLCNLKDISEEDNGKLDLADTELKAGGTKVPGPSQPVSYLSEAAAASVSVSVTDVKVDDISEASVGACALESGAGASLKKENLEDNSNAASVTASKKKKKKKRRRKSSEQREPSKRKKKACSSESEKA